MKLRKALQFLALAAVAVGIFLMRPDRLDEIAPADRENLPVETAPPPAPADSVLTESPPQPARATPAGTPPPAAITTREIPGGPGEPPLVPSFQLQKGELPWEKRVNDVLDNSKIADTDKARLLLEMLPSLPVEGRESTAEHAISRLDDSDYRHAQVVVTNPATYPPALAVLWSDLMGRSESISLPTLLTIARNSSHPYAANARENLDLMLGGDFGADWPKWEAAIRERLAKEPKR